jgi:hypothetical protein
VARCSFRPTSRDWCPRLRTCDFRLQAGPRAACGTSHLRQSTTLPGPWDRTTGPGFSHRHIRTSWGRSWLAGEPRRIAMPQPSVPRDRQYDVVLAALRWPDCFATLLRYAGVPPIAVLPN